MKRMPMMPVHQAIEKAVSSIGKIRKIIEKPLLESRGFELGEDVIVAFDLPPYSKSTVDGYAVRSKDVCSASKTAPVCLEVVGESVMGKPTATHLKAGQAQYVPTGGMVPQGADGMVMIEDTDLGKVCVNVYTPLEAGAHIINKGDDLTKGDIGLKAGVQITPRHMGLLSALGAKTIKVIEKPKVAIISTGDELISLNETPSGGQIYDINTHSVAALCESYGLEVVYTDIVKDNFDRLCNKVKSASQVADLLLMSGGSSVGEKDMTVDSVLSLPEAEVIVHGLAFKPGKPTLIAKAKDTVVLGLPGHPVSALMVMDTIGRSILDAVWDTKIAKHHRISGRLSGPVKPATGRDSCQMVRVKKGINGYEVIPLGGKSGMISWIGHSDGYMVAEHKEGVLPKGHRVTVYLWDDNSDMIGPDWI